MKSRLRTGERTGSMKHLVMQQRSAQVGFIRPSEVDFSVAERIAGLWVNLATLGDPNDAHDIFKPRPRPRVRPRVRPRPKARLRPTRKVHPKLRPSPVKVLVSQKRSKLRALQIARPRKRPRAWPTCVPHRA